MSERVNNGFFVVFGEEADEPYERFPFSVGNKSLLLTILLDTRAAYITIRATDSQYVPGATTQVYSLARNKIQEIATRDGQGVHYTFRTEDEKLIAWARDPEKGGSVFTWDTFDVYDNGVVATKYFAPMEQID